VKYLILLALAACGQNAKLESQNTQKSTEAVQKDCQALDGSYVSEDGFQDLTIKDCKLDIKFNYPNNQNSYSANLMTNHKVVGFAFVDVYKASNPANFGFKIIDNHQCTFSNTTYLAFKCDNILIQKFSLK